MQGKSVAGSDFFWFYYPTHPPCWCCGSAAAPLFPQGFYFYIRGTALMFSLSLCLSFLFCITAIGIIAILAMALLEFNIFSYEGALSITHRKYRPSARTPKSTYCLPPGIREPKVDKRVLRIRLVLFWVPAGVHVIQSFVVDSGGVKKQHSWKLASFLSQLSGAVIYSVFF